ncbi:MAG: hypothetical protein QQN63_00430 [Nitrosopumilus sp.]
MASSKLPRILHQLYAEFFGYFWIPCPICTEMMGGHEHKPGNIQYTDLTHGKCICNDCGKVLSVTELPQCPQ